MPHDHPVSGEVSWEIVDNGYDNIIDSLETVTGESFRSVPKAYRWIPLKNERSTVHVQPPDQIYVDTLSDRWRHALANGAAYALQHQTVTGKSETGWRQHLPKTFQNHDEVPFIHRYGFAEWCAGLIGYDADAENDPFRTGAKYVGPLFYEAHEDLFGVDETVAMAFNPEPRSSPDYILGVLEASDVDIEHEGRLNTYLERL